MRLADVSPTEWDTYLDGRSGIKHYAVNDHFTIVGRFWKTAGIGGGFHCELLRSIHSASSVKMNLKCESAEYAKALCDLWAWILTP